MTLEGELQPPAGVMRRDVLNIRHAVRMRGDADGCAANSPTVNINIQRGERIRRR
jgi:hypothetical protein